MVIEDLFTKKGGKKYKFPVPSRKSILFYLSKFSIPTSHEKLIRKLNIHDTNQLKSLHRRLQAMERDGQLIFTNFQCYALPKHQNLLHGTVIGHHKGFGFLKVKNSKHDYYLSNTQMKMVIHGDIVIAKSHNTIYKGYREAQIIKIITPKIKCIIGQFYINDNDAFVIPNDNRFNFNILIPSNTTYNVQTGVIVAVELIKRPTDVEKAIGKIIKVLGDNMSTDTVVNIALHSHDIPYIWHPKIKQQVSKLKKEKIELIKNKRIDLRFLPLVTIDNEDAKDFDDAIYCEKRNTGGWRLWVAIADVSYYVRPHTLLDKEASKRSTSIYFPSKVIPMLPQEISDDLCSLTPHTDKLCMICEMNISNKGDLSSYKFYEAIINSHARLTYNDVWKILNKDKTLCKNYSRLVKPLINLYEMYKILEQARELRNSIPFEIEEAKFIFNSKYRIKRIESMVRNDSTKLVEECMILANIAAACFVKKNNKPILYRVHDRPSNDNIVLLRATLKEFGLVLGGDNKPESKDYVDIINKVLGHPNFEILQTMLLRSMKQAVYDPENRGHFGLALQNYTHFTSPIRRYPDLILHRVIKHLLGCKDGKISSNSTSSGGWHYEFEEMLRLGQQCSMNERRAEEATRNVEDWIKCDFMQNYIGKSFRGTITNITNFGFFVRLNTLFIDGLVHISSLGNEYYKYDPIRQRLIGKLSGKTYRLGDTVKICVKAVHMNYRKIDFTLFSTNS